MSSVSTEAVIVSTARTPLAKSFRGSFNMSHGAHLGGVVVRAALERARIEPGEVEDVIMGCANPEGSTGGNVARISAYRAGIPANGKPVPDGARMAKIHWIPKPNAFFPEATVAGDLLNVDFMVKDSKRFADSGGWGYAVFDYNTASNTFTPGTTAGTPPQGNDAKCGFACHTAAKARDYVFTEYGKR